MSTSSGFPIGELIKQFQLTRILKGDPQTKSIALLGTINQENAIVSLEKSHFITDELNFQLEQLIEEIVTINHNDIYYWSNATLTQNLTKLPSAKVNLIYPATETHIKKYDEQKTHYVVETPEMYNKYVVPYIEGMKGDRIKWVYNILFEGKESETFVHHDTDPESGFVLLPDMKWDTINMESLYLCAIVNRKDISSVRDLNESHLPFLINLEKVIRAVTTQKFPVNSDELRIFIHYQPSYYHFHLHIVNIRHPGLGDGIAVGKAILLEDVIENIKLVGDYYQRRKIGYILGENHGLWNTEGYREDHLNSIKEKI
ncbi:trehalase-associated protein [Scheffersomyces xylosifermentans]|uniref:trehalase-associated protein n=1 Tax=Scheffersomyces xylosifermentans TaxID=1304137 RepID=UPI00315D9F3F